MSDWQPPAPGCCPLDEDLERRIEEEQDDWESPEDIDTMRRDSEHMMLDFDDRRRGMEEARQDRDRPTKDEL